MPETALTRLLVGEEGNHEMQVASHLSSRLMRTNGRTKASVESHSPLIELLEIVG